ncbi:MAG: YdcH family protein [Gammaproteobacteria bacterium]|nr:YdcH family protein [Gammaproteobacteria bacterium]
MFEYDQDIVKELLDENERFQHLYQQHSTLKTQVREAETGLHPLDDLSLNRLKRKKLLAKDKMAHIIQQHQREHA